MTKRQSKSQPTWTDVKAKLADFDRAALLGLIQSLYTAHKDNQTFLHARFGLGEDVLEPRKLLIGGFGLTCSGSRTPLSLKPSGPSLITRRQLAIPRDWQSWMVFYCERAAGFCSDVGNDDEGYFDALVRMFEQALQFTNALSVDRRDDLVARLDRVRAIGHEFGYGVGDDMEFLLSKFTRR
jgi:hypothetical protein